MKKIVGVVIACLFVFSLASCSALKKSDIVGSYELISISAGSVNYTEEELSTLKSLGKVATMEVRADNTATMDLFGQKFEMTYNTSTGIFELNGDKTKASFKDGILTFKDSTGQMEFRKVS